MRVARNLLSIAAMAAAVLGIMALALISLDFSATGDAGHARAESRPDVTAPDSDAELGTRGPILDDQPPFPIEGLYGRDDADAADEAPPMAPPEVPPAATPVDTSARFVAVYNVSLGRFNLGNFSISGTVQNGQYNLRGNGSFSVLKGWVFNWKGSMDGSGLATTDGPNPNSYSFSQSDGKYSERLRIFFGDGFVKSVKIWPKPRPYTGEIPVRKEQVQHVVDPLSGAFLMARSDNPHGDLSVCNQLIPVFDGRSRFDLVLKPKKRVRVQNRGGDNYSGPAAVCKVKFVPISGYPRGDPGIEQLRQANDIEAWMVPLRGTNMYVPYRIVMPTSVGYGTAVVTSLRVGRPGRAKAH